MHGKAIWKPGISEITKSSRGNAIRLVYSASYEPQAARGQRADAHWVINYGHKTQSFLKNGGQQNCLHKALKKESQTIAKPQKESKNLNTRETFNGNIL